MGITAVLLAIFGLFSHHTPKPQASPVILEFVESTDSSLATFLDDSYESQVELVEIRMIADDLGRLHANPVASDENAALMKQIHDEMAVLQWMDSLIQGEHKI